MLSNSTPAITMAALQCRLTCASRLCRSYNPAILEQLKQAVS